ncbi:MAG: hypothetical protein SV201_15210 [Pseudomonadota bacterium]|nr:hypothetical protein [Pseudomonadota bacterium]
MKTITTIVLAAALLGGCAGVKPAGTDEDIASVVGAQFDLRTYCQVDQAGCVEIRNHCDVRHRTTRQVAQCYTNQLAARGIVWDCYVGTGVEANRAAARCYEDKLASGAYQR